MQTRYQLIFLGFDSPLRQDIEDQLWEKISELGLQRSVLKILDAASFSDFRSNAPSVCIYFGDPYQKNKDEDSARQLLKEVCPIIPVVDDIKLFSKSVPEHLRPLNGFELKNKSDSRKIAALVSRVLEGLSLLRRARKLFISYRRAEARQVALQLYGYLDELGFNVFLDTHSIGPGSNFQQELWHHLADTDVLLLLNTQNFVGNKWTDAELAQASVMSVGIMQLVWPDCNNQAYLKTTALAIASYLTDSEFVNKDYSGDKAMLSPACLKELEVQIENLRARALAARQDNLIKEFMRMASASGVNVILQSERNILVTCGNGVMRAVIPTVGIPDVYGSYQRETLVKQVYETKVSEVWILYDHRNILSDYLIFVEWLTPLPVRFLKITDADNWLNNL